MRGAILACVFGVWCLQQTPVLPAQNWLALLAAALVALGCLVWRWPAMRHIGLIVLGFGAGFLWAALSAQQRLADALDPVWERRDIQVVGVVASMPQLLARGERFLFDVEQVETPGAYVPRRISLTRYFAGFNEPAPSSLQAQFHPGERWRITVRLKRPHGTYNPHGNDFELWALERNIRAVGYLRHPEHAVRLNATVYRPGYLVERLRECINTRFSQVLGSARYTGVLQALAIGNDDAILESDWEVFRRTGVIHLMSISGLHVTMVSGLVFALVLFGWRRAGTLSLYCPARKAAAVAGLFAAGVYALAAGFAVPTQRTLYMLAVLAIALWLGRAVSISQVLCWALLAVIALDPWAVMAPGFWLSFGAVALLAFAGSHRLARPGWFADSVRAQWVVTIGLVPLLLALFQQVSLISPLANAFAIPVVSLVVTPLTLLGAVLQIDALLVSAHAVMAGCMAALTWLADLPVALWRQHAPAAWTVVMAVAGVVWMLLPRGFPMRWAGAVAMLPMFLLVPPTPKWGEMRVVVLDVGQGLAVVLQTAKHVMVYDTGPRYSEHSDSGKRVVLPYLVGEGLPQIDALILSHDDSDHTGGALSVLDGIIVHHMLSSLPEGQPLLQHASESQPCVAGQSWEWDGVSFQVLYPSRQSYDLTRLKDNNRSCVVRVISPYGSILLTGDIERAAERALLDTGAALASDVLVVPHHGSKTSSTAAFVEAVHPAVAIFAMGYRNRFGHPKPAVVARYAAIGSQRYRSDQDGAVVMDFLATGAIWHKGWREQLPRYWH